MVRRRIACYLNLIRTMAVMMGLRSLMMRHRGLHRHGRHDPLQDNRQNHQKLGEDAHGLNLGDLWRLDNVFDAPCQAANPWSAN